MVIERLLGLLVDHRADVGRQVARIADLQRLHRAGDHLDHAVGDVFLDEQDAQGRAALAGALECRGNDVARDLLRQRRAVDDHRILAAGLGDERDDRPVALGQRAVDHARGLGRAGEDDARKQRMRGQRPADRPCRRRARAGPRPWECRPDASARSPARRSAAFARPAWRSTALPAASGADTRPVKIASGKFHGRNAREHAAAVQAQLVLLAGRARKRQRPGELAPRLGRVEAQEIDRLAHFEHRVDQGLPGLANAEGEELLRMLFVEVGGALEQLRARFAAERVPADLRGMRRRGPSDRPRRPSLRTTCRPSIRWSCGDDDRPAPRPFPSVGFAVQLRLSSAFSRSSSGSRTSGSLRSTPALLRRPAPKSSRGRTIFGLRLGSSASSSATGSRTSSSSDTSSSAMRLTKHELAPFSSRRRTR